MIWNKWEKPKLSDGIVYVIWKRLWNKAASAIWKTVSGSFPLTLSNALASAMSWTLSGSSSQASTPTPSAPVDVVGAGEPCVLIDGVYYDIPSGYTMLDSFVFNGEGYLTTPLTSFKNTYTYKIGLKRVGTTTKFLFGQNPSGSGVDEIGMFSCSGGYYIQNGGGTRVAIAVNTTNYHDIIIEDDGYTLDGTKTSVTAVSEFTISRALIIGAGWNGSAVDSRMSTDEATYFVVLDTDGSLLFVGKPAKNSSDVVGMYDFISETFLTPSSGTYTAGAEMDLSYKFPLTHAKNCGMVDLGSLTWEYNGTRFKASLSGLKYQTSVSTSPKMYCNGLTVMSQNDYNTSDNCITTSNASELLLAKCSAYTDATSFKSAMSGVYLFYQRTDDDSWTAPTEYTVYDDSQLQGISTYKDTIASSGVRTNKIKKVTLSAGTHTLTDAMTNSPYYCAQQSSGALSGQTLTLDTGVTDADVYYVLATPTTKQLTVPSISTVVGTNYLDYGGDNAPTGSATYLCSDVTASNGVMTVNNLNPEADYDGEGTLNL